MLNNDNDVTDLGPFDGPWVAHEHPEHPLDRWCWLCDCGACLIALQATARQQPRLALGLKTGADRITVTAELACAVWAREGSLDPLLFVHDDYIREVFVVAGAPTMVPGYDWTSLSAREDRHPLAFRLLADFGPFVPAPHPTDETAMTNPLRLARRARRPRAL